MTQPVDVRPGRTTKVRQKKRYRVRTTSKPLMWLHALDPLDFGRAAHVRSEWRDSVREATVFPSNMYAAEVARNNPGVFRYIVEPVP